MASTRREARIDAAIVAVVMLVLVAGILTAFAAARDFGPFAPESCGEYVFDRAAWANTTNADQDEPGDPGDPSPAQRQAEQLVRCDLLTGLTRGEVLEMLGEPQASAAPRDPRWLSYFVGIADHTYMSEPETLAIRFDKRGRATSVAMHA